MEKLVVGIITTVILIGITFFVVGDQIGSGINDGADNLKTKIVESTK